MPSSRHLRTNLCPDSIEDFVRLPETPVSAGLEHVAGEAAAEA